MIEQLLARNDELRQERNAVQARLDELSRHCDKLASHNECLYDEVQRVKMDNEQLHQQRLNDWQMRKAAEEELIKLNAKPSREKHVQGHGTEVNDIAANIHVTGSSFGSDVRDKEVQGHKDHEGQSMDLYSPRFRENGSLARDHVTSAVTSEKRQTSLPTEPVTSLPERLRSIRREKNAINSTAMLASTYPPRPRAARLQYVGQEVMELGQGQSCLVVSPVPVRSTLHLPSIPHRTSSY